MEVFLTINGKQIKATIDDKDLEKLKPQSKKTGYERAEFGNTTYSILMDGLIQQWYERNLVSDDRTYDNANYYTNEIIAKNNARADKLMRQLRRFSAEHGGCIPVKDARKWIHKGGYEIGYREGCDVCPHCLVDIQEPEQIIFTSKEACEEAIKKFHDELIWYFTEYDPMPEGYWDN